MLKKRIVLITGGSNGLGHAILQALNQQPNQILVNISRQSATLASTEMNNQFINITADLHQLDDIKQVQKEITRLLSKNSIDEAIFIHNAGQVTPMGLSTQLTDIQAIDNAYRLNISSVVALTATFLSSLKKNKIADTQTRILFISSGAGRSPISGWSVYGATKAAMDYYAQVLHQEQPNVRCVSLAPGVVDTNMQAAIRAQSVDNFPPIKRFLQLHQQQQLQSPAQTAEKIVHYLFSEEFGSEIIADIRQ